MASTWHKRIKDYLDNLLSNTERASMEEAIVEDPALAQEVELVRIERMALDLLSEEKARAEFQRWTEDIVVDTSTSPGTPSGKRRPKWFFSGAAIGLLSLIIWFWIAKPDNAGNPNHKAPQFSPQMPSELVSPHTTNPVAESSTNQESIAPNTIVESPTHPPIIFPEEASRHHPTESEEAAITALREKEANSLFSDPSPENFRSMDNQDETDRKFSEGFKAYAEAKNEAGYTNAIGLLERILPEENRYIEASYIKAHAYFKTRHYEKATACFRFVHEQEMPYSKEAKFKEALSLFAAGGKDKSRLNQLLDELKAKKLTPELKTAVEKMLKKMN